MFRTRRWSTLAATLFLALGACTTGAEPAQPTPTTQAPEPTAYPSPPDGAEVVVRELGHSSTYQEKHEEDLLSYGVILENTSHYAAIDVFAYVNLLSADGQIVRELGGGPGQESGPRFPITRLLPGERTGIGRTLPHDGDPVADLEVKIEVTKWSSVYEEFWWFRPITTSGVTTQHDRGLSTLRFTIQAGYTSDMAGASAVGGNYSVIFRDATGAVIGGADCCADPTEWSYEPVEIPPGDSTGTMYLHFGVPGQTDDSRTEIYVPQPRNLHGWLPPPATGNGSVSRAEPTAGSLRYV